MENKRPKIAPTSVYTEEAKVLPAWMKTENSRYDKYGARAPRATSLLADDKYAKYGASSARVVRREPEKPRARPAADAEPQVHQASEEQEAELELLAYTNLHVANPSSAYYQTFQSNIKNKENKDLNAIIRTHYNQRTYQSKFQGNRSKSPIIKLRNFNNIIKYILLGKFGRKLGPPDLKFTFLDLCCGKGGDLNKCEFIQVEQYIGIDISDGSVKEAFSRYSKNKARFIPRDGHRDSRRYNFEACFATGDLFQKTIPDILEPNFPGIIDELFPVDVVSIQFSLHYAFGTEDKVRCIINNVSKSLKVGGKFIGTIPSSDFIKHKVKHHEGELTQMSFGNGLYNVTFHGTPPIDGDFNMSPFGNGYNFSLKDAIDDVPEYVVPFETLRKICQDNQLVLKYSNNFIDLFNSEIPNYFKKLNKKLIESIRRSDGKYGVEGLEKEAIQFYMGFVFEKI